MTNGSMSDKRRRFEAEVLPHLDAPAWGKSLSDAAIWDMVAFVCQMPAMSPATYQELSSSHSK